MAKNIRNAWLDYYKSKGFTEIISAPLVHHAFPTSFNMSAGLVQLDPRIRKTTKIKASKECLVQKCVRHFDIGKVGDQSHLSFFEMAGVFDVVEINEIEILGHIWKFLTEELKMNPENIWITAFDKDTVADKEIELPEILRPFLKSLVGERVVYSNKETNLWKQGGGAEFTDNTRLCGPQVEFFYDFGKNLSCSKNCNPFCDCGRFLEISNTLLIYYYIDYKGEPTLNKLVNPSTESVIGVERCARIVEGKSDLYLTSHFSPLTKILGKNLDENVKIIVDHIKSLTFILSEAKIKPSKKNRGRIIRTLIRQLLTSMYVLKLDPKEKLPLLIDEVINMYGDVYPEVKRGKSATLSTIIKHEVEYRKTLLMARKEVDKFRDSEGNTIIDKKNIKYLWENWGVPEKLLSRLHSLDL